MLTKTFKLAVFFCLLAFCTILSAAQKKLVARYGFQSFTSSNPTVTSPIHFLELYEGQTFRWLRGDKLQPGGTYEYVNNRLVLHGATPSEASFSGNYSKGALVFRWGSTLAPRQLTMCITGDIDWPGPRLFCQ